MAGLIDLHAWQVIFNIMNTIILFLILRHFLFEPVKKFMDNRTKEIQESLEYAEQQKQEADRINKEYQTKLVKAHEEGREIVKTSTVHAEKKAEEILISAREEAQKIKAKANKDVELELNQATRALKKDFANIAVLAAEKIISKNIDEESSKNLIDEVINEIGDERWSS